MALSMFNRDIFSPTESFFGGDLFRPFGNIGSDIMPRMENMPRPMPLDVSESETTFDIKADIPGVKKEDIHVSVDDKTNTLTIKVDSKQEKEEDKEEGGTKWHRIERQSTFIQRALRMPDYANLDEINAKYDNGVLQLQVPKKKEAQKEAKRIDIQ